MAANHPFTQFNDYFKFEKPVNVNPGGATRIRQSATGLSGIIDILKMDEALDDIEADSGQACTALFNPYQREALLVAAQRLADDLTNETGRWRENVEDKAHGQSK